MRARYLLALTIPFPIIIHAQTAPSPSDSLTKNRAVLKNVTVSAKRDLYEQKPDRLIVNVADAAGSAGATALEVIERTPGVTVDNEGSISLKGKPGTLVLIDGKQTYLSGAELSTMLGNMPASGIDRLEVMTNPPARYDAAGGAGIILIRTKKTSAAGYNVALTGSYMQGRLPKTSEGLTVNYRQNKVNVYGSYSHSYRENFKDVTVRRAVRNSSSDDPHQYLAQDEHTDRWGNWHSGKAGIDYSPDKRTTIGLAVNGVCNAFAQRSGNHTLLTAASGETQGQTYSRAAQQTRFLNGGAGVSFRRLLDTAGREISADADYMRYSNTGDLRLSNAYIDEWGNPGSTGDTISGHLPQEITVRSAKVDYVHPLGKGFRIESGLKGSIVRTDNVATYDSTINGNTVRDVNRSNHFIYEETIAAAYASATVPLTKKLRAELGLRFEQTHATGTQLANGISFERSYAQLFPKAYLAYTADKNNTFGLSYGRGIRRPDYETLNPFVRFADRYTYHSGNPGLRPQLYNDIELSHNYRNRITTTINYSGTTDIIQMVVEQRGENAYVTSANIASLRQVGAAINLQTPVTSWWKNNLYLNVYHNAFHGDVGGTAVSLSRVAWSLDATQQLSFGRNTSLELGGQYRSAGVRGVMEQQARWAATVGISRQVLKGAGNIRLSLRDVFYTMQSRWSVRYGNVDAAISEMVDTRVLNLTFGYRFSKGKAGGPKKRSMGSAAEEQARAGGE